MAETMVNGMKFKVWNDTTRRATFAESEDGRVEKIHDCGYITADLTIRKAIAMVYGLPTFRKNAVKTASAVEETPVAESKEQETMIKVYFDGETEMGCYIQNAMVVLPEDYTMNQFVTAIKNAGYTRFMLPTMKRLVDVKEEVSETETNETTVEMTAEQTQADEAAETEPAKTPKSENAPYKMKWTNQNVDYSRANYTAVIFKFNNSKVWLQLDCVCSTQTARATIRKLGKWFGSKSVDVKYFSDQTNEKIVSVCQLYDNSGYIFRNEIAVKNGEKRQFIKYAAKEIFE